MPNPVPPLNPNGSLRPYTTEELELMAIEHRGDDDGSNPTHTREVSQNTIRVQLFCAFEEFDSFLVHMLGAVRVYTDPEDGGIKKLSRLPPQKYKAKDRYICTKLESATGFRYTGEQDEYGEPIYEKMDCTFLYQLVPFNAFEDGVASSETERYYQELPSEVTGDAIGPLPGSFLKFQTESGGAPSGTPLYYNVTKITASSVVRRKWIRVPKREAWRNDTALFNRIYGNPDTDAAPWLGTINKARYLGFRPGTLLLIGVEEVPILDQATDEEVFDLIFKFLHKPEGHNFFYFASPSGDANGFHFVSADGNYYDPGSVPDGKSLFNERDFAWLTRVAEGP